MNQFFENTKPGGQLLAMVLMVVLFFILSTGVFLVISMFTGRMDNTLLMQAVTQIISFGGTALFFAYMFYGNPVSHLRMCRTDKFGLKIAISLLILILLIPLSDWLTRVNDALHFPQPLAELERLMRNRGEQSQKLVESFLTREGIGALISNLMVLALIPAVCEEMLFRGVLQQLIVRGLGGRQHWGIIITATIFSLVHLEFFAFLPRFMLGIALGYLFHYGGSLWLNATAHFANNAIVVILYYMAQKGLVDIEVAESFGAPFYLALAGTLIAVVVFCMVFVKPKTSKADAE